LISQQTHFSFFSCIFLPKWWNKQIYKACAEKPTQNVADNEQRTMHTLYLHDYLQQLKITHIMDFMFLFSLTVCLKNFINWQSIFLYQSIGHYYISSYLTQNWFHLQWFLLADIVDRCRWTFISSMSCSMIWNKPWWYQIGQLFCWIEHVLFFLADIRNAASLAKRFVDIIGRY